MQRPVRHATTETLRNNRIVTTLQISIDTGSTSRTKAFHSMTFTRTLPHDPLLTTPPCRGGRVHHYHGVPCSFSILDRVHFTTLRCGYCPNADRRHKSVME
jgi:hypothetical protein